MGALRWLVAKGALLAGVTGVILQACGRDGYQPVAPLFYALPLPVSGAALLVAALLAGGRRARRVLVMASVLVLGWWFFQSYGWAFPVRGDWKIVTWNIARPRHPFAPLVALVRAERPDVVALVESGNIGPEEVGAYQRALPGYRMVAESKGLSCLVRGEIVGSSVKGLVNGSDLAHFRVKVGGEPLNIFVADLGAFPFLPRGPQLQMLADRTRGLPQTMVMGDFNTPLESVHLAPMRTRFDEVMDGPHRGFRETWFFTLPLLSLDHIWLSRDLESVFAARKLTLASDHAPVVATIRKRR